MRIRVFVQNEAGSIQKNQHDEKTLQYLHSESIAHAYPFPYGFVIGTEGGDGGNVDCYVITTQTLKTGQIVECEAIGLWSNSRTASRITTSWLDCWTNRLSSMR